METADPGGEQDQPAAEPDEDEIEQGGRIRLIMMPYG